MKQASAAQARDTALDLEPLDDLLDGANVELAAAALQDYRRRVDDPAHLLRLQSRELRMSLSGEMSQALVDTAFDLLEQAERLQDPLALADCLVLMSRVQGRTHMHTLAVQSLGRAEALYDSLGDTAAKLRCLVTTSKVLHEANMHEEAIRRLEPLLQQPEWLSSLPVQTRHILLTNLAAAYSFTDRTEEVGYWYRFLYQESRQLQLPGNLYRDSINLANHLIWQGELDTAAALLEEARGIAERHQLLPMQRTFYLQNCALLAWKSGRHQEALPLFDQARESAERHKQPPILMRTMLRKAECAEEAGNWAAALEARSALVNYLQARLRTLQQQTGASLIQALGHARTQAQNEYLRQHGNELELELAERNRELQQTLVRLQAEVEVRRAAEAALAEARDALEIKVQERTRELERAMRALLEREKQAALSHLVAGVAHELNTPIGNALLATSTMSDSLRDHAQAFQQGQLTRQDMSALYVDLGEGLGISKRGLARAAELVRSFKALALDQDGMTLMDYQPQQVIGNMLAVMGTALREAQVEVDSSQLDDSPLHGDPGAFGQVMAQLLDNCLMHAFKDWNGPRRLQLAGHTEDGHYELAVIDSGHGIAPEHLPRIFDPFFSTQLGQGTSGLGLHLVYRLVTQSLQGEIEVHSRPGEGCRVTLHLPIQQTPPSDGR